MAKEVLQFFRILLCIKAGLSMAQWVEGAQQANGQLPRRDYSELQCSLVARLFMSGSVSCHEVSCHDVCWLGQQSYLMVGDV